MPQGFINCDWGTSRFRLRAVDFPRVDIAAQIVTDQGVARLSEGGAAEREVRFRQILAEGLARLSERPGVALEAAPCLISGMASSSVGWHELPYARLPQPVDGSGLVWREIGPVTTSGERHRVVLISGVASAHDVMRGEETELVGLFALPQLQPLAARSLVILPGTHSKHVTIHDGQIVDFWTFMTGELFEVLGLHSILRHSIGEAPSSSPEMSGDVLAAFRSGVEWAGARPLAAALFRVRTRQVLDGAEPEANRAFLSGLLVGGELAYLAGEAWRDTPIVLCAAERLAAAYLEACNALGLHTRLTCIAPADTARLSALGQSQLLRLL